jgi:D-alanyl-D-alanine carboxypeptidase
MRVRSQHGNVTWTSAGTDGARGRAPELADRWRIASVTKPFVAALVLGLVEEGRLELDAPVSRYVPELLPDAPSITVRELLQHTSGLADYHDFDGLDSAADFVAHRFENPSAEDRIALSLAHSPVSAAGSEYHYTDTNYRVLELLVETVTATDVARALDARLLRPLGLGHTSYPTGEPGITGSHLFGYMPGDSPDEPFGDQTSLVDFTEQTIDQTGAAGALVSNAADLDGFLHALLAGDVLGPEMLGEMRRTVPVDAESQALGITGSGLGLETWDLGCGELLGHGGSTRGFTTIALARSAEETTVLVVAQDPLPMAAYEPTLRAAALGACQPAATDEGG